MKFTYFGVSVRVLSGLLAVLLTSYFSGNLFFRAWNEMETTADLASLDMPNKLFESASFCAVCPRIGFTRYIRKVTLEKNWNLEVEYFFDVALG